MEYLTNAKTFTAIPQIVRSAVIHPSTLVLARTSAETSIASRCRQLTPSCDQLHRPRQNTPSCNSQVI